MAALEELELGIDHIRNAFKRADNGFTNAYKMLEAEQQKNRNLEAENAKLRKFAMETIRLMQADGPDCGLCKHYDECWSDEATNFSPTGCIICNEARELEIEVK